MVFVECRTTPESSLVLSITPEIVVVLTVFGYEWDPLIGIQDCKQIGAQFVKAAVCFDSLLRDRIAGFYPFESFLTPDIFKPLVGIRLLRLFVLSHC